MAEHPTSKGKAWQALAAHVEDIRPLHLRDLFADDQGRFARFSVEACGLMVDFSKNRITSTTLDLLCELARETGLVEKRRALLGGDRVNSTENRAALHTALRHRGPGPYPHGSNDVMPEVREVLGRLETFAHAIRSGEWKGYGGKKISSIVNIGIGGSGLGPAMVAHALRPFHSRGLESAFVSNLDSAALSQVFERFSPESTLFVVASKTFSTQETLTNARSARQWVVDHFGSGKAVARHFVAVSTQQQRVREFGIDTDNMYGFWDWVGGRYSIWSAIGLSVVILIGMRAFEDFLEGAAEMDQHFRDADLAENLPVVLGLIGVWYRNFFKTETHAVLPYDFALRDFPAYLQQLEMESNGKHVNLAGGPVEHDTSPILWGALGNNGQHAFYQLLHQGTTLVSADFIVPVNSQYPLPGHENAYLANALAQSEALLKGRTLDDAQAMLRDQGVDESAVKSNAAHRVMQGNQPTTTIIYDRLTPRVLGALIALYEHKVFVQSVCWGVNPFDQWGVELGKVLANVILAELEGESGDTSHDSSTRGLIEHVLRARGASNGP